MQVTVPNVKPDAEKTQVGADGFIWGLMLQFGCNMWGEEADHMRLDYGLWKEVTEKAAGIGVNAILMDLGEAMYYPSRPELAVEGSWRPEKMRAELDRLRGLGLEPLPKLNFSACHDAWLKEYGRMVSTKEYYRVCADVIRDVCEIFDRPRYFHLGWDEERVEAQDGLELAIERRGDLWWHDFLFIAGEVEKHGSKAWLWSDYEWKHKDLFMKRMPKRILQSNWYYHDEFKDQTKLVRNEEMIQKLKWPEHYSGIVSFLELEEAGFDQLPCGSNVYEAENFAHLVPFCMDRIPSERLKGFLMAPWVNTYGEEARAKLFQALGHLEIGIKYRAVKLGG